MSWQCFENNDWRAISSALILLWAFCWSGLVWNGETRGLAVFQVTRGEKWSAGHVLRIYTMAWMVLEGRLISSLTLSKTRTHTNPIYIFILASRKMYTRGLKYTWHWIYMLVRLSTSKVGQLSSHATHFWATNGFKFILDRPECHNISIQYTKLNKAV